MSRQRSVFRGVCRLLQHESSVLASSGASQSLLVGASSSIISQPALLHRAAAAFSRSIATSSALHSNLSSLLKEELKYEKENYTRPEQVSGGPPAPFKLTESPGDTLITLSRSHNGEEINIDLHVNNQPSTPFSGEDGDDEGISTVVFNVSVVKDGKALVFECESDGNSTTINHVSLEPKDGFESESMYTGPVFDELDDNMQRQFSVYLEDRGVNAELGEYLRFLIYDKEQREYQNWLGDVEKFVSK